MQFSARFKAAAVAVSILAVIGALHLPTPLAGDQALFMVGAREMEGGAKLYVDYWDFKQPGIYLFNLLAGKLFGFHEHGLHLLELFYLLVAAAFMAATVPLRHGWIAPVAAFGTYYMAGSVRELTQLEMLVTPLIYFCLWAASRERARPGLMFAAGVAAGTVAVFKLVLAALPVVLLVAGVRRWRPLLWAVAGALAAVAPVIVWAAWHGALDELLHATFVYPRESASSHPWRSVWDLAASAKWFVLHFSVWVAAAAVALPMLRKRRDAFWMLAAAWVPLGFGLIAIQVISWWNYHFLLLMVPVALLAALALDRLPGRWAAGAAAAGLLIYTPQMARKLKPLTWAALTQPASKAARDYQIAISPVYRRVTEHSRFLLARDAASGPIYVAGNPAILWLTERKQGLSLDGWSFGLRTPSQWRDFPGQLRRSRVPYVFISDDDFKVLEERSPATLALLSERYRLHSQGEEGDWYELVDMIVGN